MLLFIKYWFFNAIQKINMFQQKNGSREDANLFDVYYFKIGAS